MSTKDPWGYCEHCQRLIPIDKEGQLTVHTAGNGQWHHRPKCQGSLGPPSEQPGPETEPWDGADSPPVQSPPARKRGGEANRDPFGIKYSEVNERLYSNLRKDSDG